MLTRALSSTLCHDAAMKHYPALPHGAFSEPFDDVFFVKGQAKMPMLLPVKFSRAMTVLRDPETRELTVVNSMRLTEAGFAELDQLGTVTNVVRLAGFQGRDDGYYRERYGTKIHALTGQFYSRKIDGKVPEQPYLEPDAWLDEGSQLPVPGATLKLFAVKPAEGMLLLERDGGILIVGDSLQNMAAPDEFTNLPAKLLMKKMGFFKAHSLGPGWVKVCKPSSADLRAVLDLEFEHLLPAHGEMVIGDAKAKFRPAIEAAIERAR